MTALTVLTSKLASRMSMGEGSDLIPTLKATAFRGQVSDAQMTALMVVAHQYGLNPWTKEIYAFPDKNNGIVPVVGLDGWARIINEHPQFDGMDFAQDAESCTCTIYRKDRSHPIRVTEWMDECKRNTGPWGTHPKRMLRHKATIQCARLAFGFAGIYDQDEAERIVESVSHKVIDPATSEVKVFELEAALAEVESAKTLEGLNTVWKIRGDQAVDVKDTASHAKFKKAVFGRKAELQAALAERTIDAEQPAEAKATGVTA